MSFLRFRMESGLNGQSLFNQQLPRIFQNSVSKILFGSFSFYKMTDFMSGWCLTRSLSWHEFIVNSVLLWLSINVNETSIWLILYKYSFLEFPGFCCCIVQIFFWMEVNKQHRMTLYCFETYRKRTSGEERLVSFSILGFAFLANHAGTKTPYHIANALVFLRTAYKASHYSGPLFGLSIHIFQCQPTIILNRWHTATRMCMGRSYPASVC